MLYEYLKENYKTGEPILLQDIKLNISYDNLCQQVKHLVDTEKLCRYMDGVFFLPKPTKSGIPFTINADSVAESKYISNKNDVFGCYTGHTLANIIGISEQVPQVKEIVSNKSSAITRTVKVGKFSYIVRKAATTITKDNSNAIMLLEILKDIDNLADSHINSKACLQNFVRKNEIKKTIVDKLLPSYPLKTYKAIYDMELINVFA